jgi:hypothetical protein
MAAALIVAGPAMAAGGRDIRSAPTVVYGEQQFGNAATDGGSTGSCFQRTGQGNSWWLLPVSTGDEITIQLEGESSGDGLSVRVYPNGTNEFNVEDTDYYVVDTTNGPEDAERLELVFTAPVTGTMPMDVVTCDSVGSYAFTAYVRHRVRLSVPRIPSLPTSGTVAVDVRTPDGGTVDDAGLFVALQMRRRGGRWKTVGTSTVGNSTANVSYAAPRKFWGRRPSVRAVSGGANYVTQYSRARKIRIR